MKIYVKHLTLIEKARGEIILTYFEMTHFGGIVVFQKMKSGYYYS